MAAGSHFVKKNQKKNKLRIDLKWRKNAIERDFRSSEMAAGSHFVTKMKKKSCVLIWNGEKCDRKWLSVIQNGRQQPLWKKSKLRMARNAPILGYYIRSLVCGCRLAFQIISLTTICFYISTDKECNMHYVLPIHTKTSLVTCNSLVCMDYHLARRVLVVYH